MAEFTADMTSRAKNTLIFANALECEANCKPICGTIEITKFRRTPFDASRRLRKPKATWTVLNWLYLSTTTA